MEIFDHRLACRGAPPKAWVCFLSILVWPSSLDALSLTKCLLDGACCIPSDDVSLAVTYEFLKPHGHRAHE